MVDSEEVGEEDLEEVWEEAEDGGRIHSDLILLEVNELIKFFSVLFVVIVYIISQLIIAILKIRSVTVSIFCQSVLGVLLGFVLSLFLLNFPSFTFSLVNFHWFLIVLLLSAFIMKSQKSLRLKYYIDRKILFFITAGFIAPLSEEIFFRWLILFLSDSIFVSSLLFSLMHVMNVISRLEKFSMINFLYRFIIGLILSDSVMKSQSLFPAVLYHSINNIIAFLTIFGRGADVDNIRRYRWLWEDNAGEPSKRVSKEEGCGPCGDERAGGDERRRENQGNSDEGGSNSPC